MRIAAVLSLGAVLAASSSALAGPPPRTARAQLPAALVPPMGRSVGSPTEGHLVGGSHLPTEPYLRVVPAYAQDNVRYGLGALVGMIERAGRRLARQFPGAVLSVGDLSRAGGGEIERHASHESGRDADIAFFVNDARGRQIFADHFVPFRADGTAPTWPGAHFDDARNWALVTSVLEDPVAHVSHIFVSAPLRLRLLQYAARIGAPEALRTQAAFTMVQPHGSLPHDDHFHVRIACPGGMTSCIENPIVHARRHAVGRRHGQPRPDAHAPAASQHSAGHGAEPRTGNASAPAQDQAAEAEPALTTEVSEATE